MTDSQHLLAEYRQNGSDAAFRELVERFVDLVYSTALRLVEGDTYRAEDVTQTVFVNLSRKARTLPEDVKLGGWLHRDTCFAAATLMRGERRRQSRESQAVEMNTLQNHSEADFSQVAPLLDEAINELGEADRTAILLRFFEQQDFRAVGQALGSNEDAARMRVTRALEKLEEFLKRRGVTTSAASLGVLLTANAVQAAPAGLAVTISTAAALAGTTIAAITATTAIKTIAMTTLQKTIIGTTLAAAVGTGIFEANQASTLRTQVQALRQQQAPLEEQVQQLTKQSEDAARQLTALRDENERLNRNSAELLRLRGEVGRLRSQAVKDSSTASAPTSATVSIPVPTNQTEFDNLKMQMATALGRIGFVLRQYMTNNPLGAITDDSGQVNQNIFSNSTALPLDPFQVMVRDAQHLASAIELHPKLIIAKTKAPIPFDGRYTHSYLLADGSVISTTLGQPDGPIRNGFLISETELKALAETEDPVRKALRPALEAFAAANNGRRPTDPSQLQPYITTPEQQAVLNKEIERRKSAGKP